MTSWVHQMADGTLPASSADAPPPQTTTSTDFGHGWWTSAWAQLIVLAALVLVFAGGLLWAFADPRFRATGTVRRFARLLAGFGLVSVLATVGYAVSILAFNAQPLGPVVASRALVWLGLQVLALLTAALLAGTAIATARAYSGLVVRHRIALGVLLLFGCLWMTWATTWALFSV